MFGDSDYSSPIMGPLLKALQIKDYLERSSYERERRDQEREQYKLAMEDRKRAQSLQDFHTALTLHQMYATPVAPGVATRFMNPHQIVDTPIGSYALPTEEETLDRQEEIASRQPGVNVTLPAFGDQPSQKVRLSRNEYIKLLPSLRDMKAEKYANPHYDTDDDGNLTFSGFDQSGKPVSIPFGKKGKIRTESDAKLQAVARTRARRRVNEEYTGAHRQEMIRAIENGLYQTLAQERGITWQTERDQDADSGARALITQVRRDAHERAEKQLKDDLQTLEDRYTDEELGKGESPMPDAKRSPIKTPAAAAAKPDPKKQTQHEQYYKDNYGSMTATERADFERRFKSQYGRPPQR